MGRGIAVAALATGMILTAGVTVPLPPGPDDRSGGPAGRVEHPDGSPAAGALVTAARADGATVTVYARADGTFELPDGIDAVEGWTAWLPGRGRDELRESGPSAALRLGDVDPVPPAGSAWLSELPAGPDTRRFILDCTGCHVTDGSRVETPDGPRSVDQWAEAILMMRTNFGPGTGFPIISEWSTPERLAPWAAEHLSAARPQARPLDGPVPAPGETGPVLTEYPVPVPGDLPHDLMVDGEGTVWVTGMFTHRMYTLDPASGDFGTVPIPVDGANPRALDIDDAGRIWVVLGAPGQVAIHDPADGSWEARDVGLYAHSVMVGPDGVGWVNGHFTVDPEVIASVDGETGEVRRYTVPPAAGGGAGDASARPAVDESTIPYGLRVAPDGIVWGTQLRGNRLVRMDPATGQVDQWAMPEPHAGPRRPDVAPDGSVWIPLYAANALARFDPVTATFETWEFPVPGALPYVARVDQERGTVWIGTGHGDVVASFDPEAEAFTVYPLPTRGALVRHLDVDEARDVVWFAYGASPGIPGRILRLQPGGRR